MAMGMYSLATPQENGKVTSKKSKTERMGKK
jgi:hypothetical protein